MAPSGQLGCRIPHTSSMARLRIRMLGNYAHVKKHFVLERIRIERHFTCFECELRRNRLVCRGIITPAEGCDSYHIRIDYELSGVPKVRITQPSIEPSAEYHMYPDGSLCLYDHREAPWSARMMLHETVIPWTAEWTVFYELWRLTGEWLGPVAPHDMQGKTPDSG